MKTILELLGQVIRVLAAYVRAQVFIALVVSIIYAVGFAIFHVPLWFLIAPLCGLLNAIPLIGTPIGMLIAAFMTWMDRGDLWRIGGVLCVFLIGQIVDGFFLTPRSGRRMGLRPMVVGLALLVGSFLLGPLALILVVPALAVANVFWKFLQERRVNLRQ